MKIQIMGLGRSSGELVAPEYEKDGVWFVNLIGKNISIEVSEMGGALYIRSKEHSLNISPKADNAIIIRRRI